MDHDVIFTDVDLAQIDEHGLNEVDVLAQIDIFIHGIPAVKLDRPCTVSDGIVRLQNEEMESLVDIYREAALAGRAMKFVPASGAATRMFKTLLSCYHKYFKPGAKPMSLNDFIDNPDYDDILRMKDNCGKFAFSGRLQQAVSADGMEVETLINEGRCDLMLAYLLTEKGLDYSCLPKGLIDFHCYADHVRTPFMEHLVEAVDYIKDKHGVVRLHFTISPEHRQLFQEHLEQVRGVIEAGNTRYEVTFSVQKPSTDTIAVDHDNVPFRNVDGSLVFRPGGHGALLENLNDLKGDIVFIKNIDNVVPDRLKPEICRYHQVLGGYLVNLQQRIFSYLQGLDDAVPDDSLLAEITAFVQDFLGIEIPSPAGDKQVEFLRQKLNRPLRVCGMVKNEGEPGGGPFWVRGPDQGCSRQIVESSQVDFSASDQADIWQSSTHFNPVDLVCALRDYRGEPFDLHEFSDPDTGFIAVKSSEGKELKALEHPGLWNGAMAEWNTVFIEVPASTFNPVKSVFDLLRPAHQTGEV